MSGKQFVKSSDTSVAPEKSRMEIEQMLRRYGAVGFSFSHNMETGQSLVDFVVPDSPKKNAPRIPVRIPINTFDVFDSLYGQPTIWRDVQYVPRSRPYTHDPKKIAQAERVAWRNLVLWIDAALSAATIGLRTIAETFAGDRLVTDDAGNTMRVSDLLQQADGALPRGGRLLLLGSGVNGNQP